MLFLFSFLMMHNNGYTSRYIPTYRPWGHITSLEFITMNNPSPNKLDPHDWQLRSVFDKNVYC